ncbi:Muc19 precursor [Halorubrum aidingense JCM 13560]|uniref:Muc19 n=1 Tax=Halorubrum aidingense JCM 13560 TaxID=1230454 RepID=M0PB51_9EURY|nr:Muc19 precursor [Halorubrum aidingense JCM 13560]
MVDDSGNAVSGVTVEAVYDGQTVASTETNADGYYDFQVSNEDNSLEAGDEVEITTDGASDTIEWQSGAAERLDLSGANAPDDGGDGSTDDGGADDDTDDDGASGGGGGGGGGGGAGTGDGPDTDAEPPEPPADVDVESDETADLAFDSETGQTTATFSEDSAVASVAFDFETDGTVNARTLSAAPDETGPAPGAEAAVSQITVGDSLTNNAATIRKRVSQDRLDEIGAPAEDLTAFRFADGEWQALDTDVVEETDAGATVEFETPGFSYFAVSATGEPTAAFDAPGEVDAGDDVELDASASEDEYGEIASYDWSVGGESLSGETATTTLDDAGDVDVELTVTNDAGETDTTTQTISVLETGDGDGTADPTPEDDGLPVGLIGGIVVLLLVLVGLGVFARGQND